MKLGILLHEHDLPIDETMLFIRFVANAWRGMGIEVQAFRGVGNPIPVDLLIPQVDMTTTPNRYRRFIESHPRVLNRDLYDISKKRISSNILSAGTSWRGPVIVKPDLNCGGRPERRIAASDRRILSRGMRLVRGDQPRRPDPIDYSVFDSPESVPTDVWRRDDLIVERFLPEREGDLYFLRSWLFLGSRGLVIRIGGPDPLVKAEAQAFREEIEDIPDEVIEFRRRFRVDYGKIDFVISSGAAIVLDLNPTPGIALPPSENHLRIAQDVAMGIESLM